MGTIAADNCGLAAVDGEPTWPLELVDEVCTSSEHELDEGARRADDLELRVVDVSPKGRLPNPKPQTPNPKPL